ncbi:MULTISPECIES: HVO_2523 family zinc finger protein [Halobacterium]|nr:MULTISPECIES: HVO_2523 family zinc finger protein [Halobacterium]MCG1003776.1 hypothetical protein [Halobacterium noricense]
MSEQSTGTERGGSRCPMCDAAMFKRHCKYVCPQHGVLYDCSDTFWVS